jgi:hypothetical protein
MEKLSVGLTPPTAENVAAVAALLQANQASSGGALTGDFPNEKVTQMLQQDSPVISAWEGEELQGVLFTAPASTAAHVPVLAAMRAAWPGREDDYLYGPVCIAQSARGKGVLPQLYAALQRHLPGRAAVLFITDDNVTSRRAHERLGMRAVASFDWNGQACWVYTDA